MKGDNMLEAKKICKHFEGLKAVNDVSFTIEKGEILGLIGPNGAGKTTIFNMIAAVFPLTSGEIYFNGKLISNSTFPPGKYLCTLKNQYESAVKYRKSPCVLV